jgi:hypothetical protein
METLVKAALGYTRIRQRILAEWQPPCGCAHQVGQFLKCSDCPSALEYRQKLKAAILREEQS